MIHARIRVHPCHSYYFPVPYPAGLCCLKEKDYCRGHFARRSKFSFL